MLKQSERLSNHTHRRIYTRACMHVYSTHYSGGLSGRRVVFPVVFVSVSDGDNIECSPPGPCVHFLTGAADSVIGALALPISAVPHRHDDSTLNSTV